MAEFDREVLIVGGGISGLATAAILAKNGIAVELWERDARERTERPGAERPRRTSDSRSGTGPDPRPGAGERPGTGEATSASPEDGALWKDAPKTTDWAALGERWLGKVGIVFVVLAVGFFVKYSFDQGWITPMLRVVLGLLLGAGLLVLGLRLEGSRRESRP